jgi:hypothetical protein
VQMARLSPREKTFPSYSIEILVSFVLVGFLRLRYGGGRSYCTELSLYFNVSGM